MRLANLFGATARQLGVEVQRAKEPVDISIVFEERSPSEGGQEAPNIGLSWQGWEETARLTRDTLESVSADKLQRSGRVATLALMILGRETQY
jgi:hypothetical protein